MKLRIFAYSVLLLIGLGYLSVQTRIADRVQNRLAYAGLVAQLDNESDPSRPVMLAQYDRTDHLVLAGATHLLGDSIAFKAPFKGPCIANRGIGGERSDQLLANVDRWPSLRRAGAVVIAVGTNDVWQRRPEALGRNVEAILRRIDAPVTLVGLTADIKGIEEANAVLRSSCRTNCTFILPVGARAEDGIHLTRKGYEQIAARVPLRCGQAVPTGV